MDTALAPLREGLPLDIQGVHGKACSGECVHPEALIAKIDAPVVNIGTFGYDGHMFTERVEKRHSFEAVPRMVKRTVAELLAQEPR